jgi:hypothetical protein
MLIAFPSADAIWPAVLTMSNEDSEYPVENIQNNDAADTAKATGTSTTIDIDIPFVTITPVGVMIANTNATTGTLESSAGPMGTFTFPSRTPDGKQRNGWIDLRGLNVTDNHFEIDLSKSGGPPVEVGRICLVTAWQAPEVLVAGAGQSPTFGHRRPGQIENVTKGGVTHRRTAAWAAPRRVTISCFDVATLAILQQLEAESNGLGRGFLLVPNEDVNDAWFAQCAFEDFEYVQEQPDDGAELFPVKMTIHEIAMGLPPGVS